MGSANPWKQINKPKKLIENRVSFAGPHAELSIYDTYQASKNIELDSGELLYCGMISGRKIMHGHQLNNSKYEIEVLPHESFVLAPSTTVEIDFPEAQIDNPTRCITVEIDRKLVTQISKKLHQAGGFPLEHFNCHSDESSIFHTTHTEGTQRLIERLFHSFTQNDIDRDIAIDFGVSELVTRMLRHQGQEFLLSKAGIDAEQNGIQASLALIKRQLSQPLVIDELCKAACMSRSLFYSEFKKQLGCTPTELQQQLRLKEAAKRLAAGETVTRVCFDLGYANLSHFSRRFHQQFGKPPSHVYVMPSHEHIREKLQN